MSTKRDVVLDAAIELLGSRGMRGLTHRGVDALAGMPQGSTSNYFRSRSALLEGIVTRLEERDRRDWDAMSAAMPGSVDEMVASLSSFARHATGPDRVRTSARYALFVEAATTPALQELIGAVRGGLIEWGAAMLENIGTSRPAHTAELVIDYLDGRMLRQLAIPSDDFDPTPGIREVLATLG